MLCVIAFCSKDHRAAENLLRWMEELDGQQARHRLLLVASATLSPEMRFPVHIAGAKAFAQTYLAQTLREDERPWPHAPNTMFQCAVRYIDRVFNCPFWWNEPDCIPLKPGWLDQLEAEYLRANKPFMGSVVDKPTRHLTGCAIYPQKLWNYNRAIMSADKQAFDCVQPIYTLKHTHHTRLFHHQWSDPDGGDVPTYPNVEKLATIPPEAVVAHRNKDHTLIDRLREQRTYQRTNAVEGLSSESAKSDASLEGNMASAVHLTQTGCEAQPSKPERDQDASSEIYTYYEPVPGHQEPVELIDLWKQLWSAQGWTPIVLGEKEARQSVRFHLFSRAISKLPTVNHPAYERACYMRHLAMSVVGGGFLTDYDVMPRKFTPADALAAHKNRSWLFEPTRVPCALHAGPSGFERIVDLIFGYKVDSSDTYAGKPHTSDMEIIRKLRSAIKLQFRVGSQCVEYLCSGKPDRDDLGDGWRTAPMIHFATGSFRKLGLTGPKHELIKKALEVLPKL